MKRWLNILALSWAGVALAHLPPPRPLALPPPSEPSEEVVCRSWLSGAISTDATGNVTERWFDPSGREIRRYSYDPNGNLRQRTNNTLTQHFGNNALNELTTVTRNGPFTVAGNTLTAGTNVTVNGTTAARYADRTWAATNFTLINGDNTFTVIAHHPVGVAITNTTLSSLPSSLSLAYDLNGNLTNDGLRNFAYDAENQLTTNWVTGAWKQEFVYDGLGRKRVERSYGWTNNAWLKTNEVRLVWDGMLTIQERNAGNEPLATYTRGLDLSASLQGAGGIGGLLARTDHTITNANFATVYYHADGAGNITALVNTNGLVVARYLYDPFSRLLAKSGALADVNRYRFSSKEVQPLSGLYYYGFRFYEPSLQRWLNQDPLGEEGGLNLYQFVHNSPLSWVDPDGWQPTPAVRPQMRPPVEPRQGEITQEILRGLRRSRAEQLEFEWERDWQTRRNSRELNERYYPNPLNLTGQPEMRALIPRPAQPSRSEQRPASQNQSQCVNQNAPPNVTYLYQKVGAQGEHLKFGVTDSPSTRYSEAQLKGGRLRIVAQGERPEMLRLEREIHETLPIGSEEGQQFYIRMQVQKGLLPPAQYPFPP